MLLNNIYKNKKIKEAKNRYEQIIDTINDGLCVISRDYEITSCNKAFAEKVGLPIRKILKRKCREIIPRYEHNLLAKHCAHSVCDKTCGTSDVFSNGKTKIFVEESQDKNGRKYYHYISIFPTKESDGFINQVVMTIRNITAQREAEEKIKQLSESNQRALEQEVVQRTRQLDDINKKLSQAIKLKSKFIADASHELRTPLTVIQGNLDLAIRESIRNNCEPSEFFAMILNEVEQMTSILSDLTILTNADSHTEKILYEEVDLGFLIKSVGQSLKVLADQKKIVLIFKEGAKSVKIFGDEAKLEKLLLNITRNAIKYSEMSGRVKIWVEHDDKKAQIVVEDKGVGIPKEDLPYIFERFYRVDKSRSRDEGGTGLGLSICKWIAELHGGRIEVESEFGKGSTFWIVLPYDYKNQPLVKKML